MEGGNTKDSGDKDRREEWLRSSSWPTRRSATIRWKFQKKIGELLKLGIDIGESSVSKYLVRCRKPPSQTWRTFLDNHVSQLVSVDFFTVPAIRFQVLYVFLVLAHDRRRILHFKQLRDMGIEEVLSTPHSPWQRAYIERVIGSIRRECLDHVIVFDEGSLRRILSSSYNYYHRSRTHLSREKDAPEPRAIQPPEMGPLVALPQVGGLHHRYQRQAA